MSDKQTITHASFVIEKTYPAAPERVFQGFADPKIKQRWHGGLGARTLEKVEMDFRPGGIERWEYRMGKGTPLPEGTVMTNETRYHDIVPNKRIVWVYTMAMNGKVFSSSQASVEFLPKGNGTEMVFTEQGAYLENSDGPEMRKEGWTGLIARLSDEIAR